MIARRALAAAAALALVVSASVASAAPPLATFEDSASGAKADERYVFCRAPKKPLRADSLELCPLAKEAPECEGFARACDEALKPRTEPEGGRRALERVGPVLASIGKVLVWAFLVAIAAALLVPIVRAILAARRRGDASGAKPEAPGAKRRELESAPAAQELARGDALEALGRADRALADGRHDESTSLYLAAMLRALDARGLVTIARHRTNGEYVRACDDDRAREDLRQVVREVDRAEFGHAPPSRDRAEEVAARARRLVTALVATAVLLAGVVGCAAPAKKRPRVDDPAGLELFADALAREGLTVSAPPSSLATLPMLEPGARSPVLFVDASRTALEEDSGARLARWVESGGVLVLAGNPAAWPSALGATPAPCPSATVRFDDAWWLELHADALDDDVIPAPPAPAEVRVGDGACLARPRSLVLARSGSASFAVRFAQGEGVVVAVGSAEPFTNVSLTRPSGARAVAYTLRALGDSVSRGGTVWIARPNDGVPPPSNPLAALARAGLVQGLVHGLVFAALLFLAAGVRHARATPERPPIRRAFVEHVLATGAFYAKRRAARHALAAQARYADEEIRGRAPRDPAEALRAAAATSGTSVEELERLLAFATAQGDDDPKTNQDLADLAALTRIVGRLQKPTKEV